MKCFNGFTGETVDLPSSSTIQQLRQPGKYWVVSDAQLKRDLAGRTLKDVYRDNHAGRMTIANWGTQYSPSFGKYEPRTMNGPSIAHGPRCGNQTLLQEYLADCYARGHTPHPASIDSDHPRNCHREKMPRKDIDYVLSVPPLAMAA